MLIILIKYYTDCTLIRAVTNRVFNNDTLYGNDTQVFAQQKPFLNYTECKYQ